MPSNPLERALFEGWLGHATSLRSLTGIVAAGAVLPAASLTCAIDGEGASNPTLNDFVALDDGDHPLAADSLLLRLGLIEGADPSRLPMARRVERLLADVADPDARGRFHSAALRASYRPDPARSAIVVQVVDELILEIWDGCWVESALAHLLSPPPYDPWPSTGHGVRARLLHDLLLQLGYCPGSRGAYKQRDAALVSLAENAASFRTRLTLLRTRHAQVVTARQRVGIVLLFHRQPLVSIWGRGGERELQVRDPAGVSLETLGRVVAPPGVHDRLRGLLGSIEITAPPPAHSATGAEAP